MNYPQEMTKKERERASEKRKERTEKHGKRGEKEKGERNTNEEESKAGFAVKIYLFALPIEKKSI